MAESKLVGAKNESMQATRDGKAKAGSIISATASTAGTSPAKPRMTIWDLPDEVTATVLAELRM